LATVEVDIRGVLSITRSAVFPSARYPGLEAVVHDYGVEPDVTRACFAIAGPVVDGEVHTPNLPWTVREADLGSKIGINPTKLINDFHAVGHGVLQLTASDVQTLQVGTAVENGAIALIGPGTGLGQAVVMRDGGGYRVEPSEGGHASLAARTEVEWGLVQYLAARHGSHVSYERAVSGPALIDLYGYVVERGLAPGSAPIRAEMAAENAPAVITRHALAATDAACEMAVELFVSLLGSQAGNFALTTLATGGVYIAGGIARRIVPLLARGSLLKSFADKGRFARLLAAVPVHVIVNDSVGLLGAAAVAARL
jgi:glucokinase